MLAARILTDEQTAMRRHFMDFLESDRVEAKYTARISTMISEGKNRLIIDLSDLLDFVPPSTDGQVSLGHHVINGPGATLPIFEMAVHDVVLKKQPEYLKVDYRSRTVHIGLEGAVGEVLGPRDLRSRHLNTVVALEGVVTRVSPLQPRVMETVHYCADTNKFTRKEYRDQLSPMIDSQHLPTVNVMPKTDFEGHVLRTELGLSTFMDSQAAVLQEAPEQAPTGQLPRSVELRFEDDLVDVIKPGDRVSVVGTYAAFSNEDDHFQTILLVNHVVPEHRIATIPRLLDNDVSEIKKFCAKHQEPGAGGVLGALIQSIAPSIYGLDQPKKAVLLMMVGGVERKAHNTHIRGDINVLLVGEPSTAKSQLLRYVLGVVPLSLSTTGKGSSGVGLTAAVTTDPYSGDRQLSAGAMVLADRGVLCIDEFDKMSPQDRVSMHEAMEQQTVTIAKAGIQASLNARCSVLAAANPIYGFYSVKHKLSFNVGLPDSLLSRFDLTFIILDSHSSEHNRRIGSHILNNHLRANTVPFNAATSKTIVSARPNAEANRGATSAAAGCPSVEFLCKYVHYAKTFTPMLTEQSQQMIRDNFVELRSEQASSGKDGLFITARTLESMIRLATAHAKLRLSNYVEEIDVEEAMELLRSSVHAGGDAAMKRQEDNRNIARRPGEAEAGDTPAAKAPRREGASSAPAAPSGSSPPAATPLTPEDHRAIMTALTTLRRHQPEAQLHEVRDALPRGTTVSLLQLKDALSALQSDDIVFSSTESESVVRFL